MQRHSNHLLIEIGFVIFSYTRNLVDTDKKKYELMVLCWNTERGRYVNTKYIVCNLHFITLLVQFMTTQTLIVS